MPKLADRATPAVPAPNITKNLWPLVSAASVKPPRIHVLSDVHLDHGPYELPANLEYDILVAPGDMGPLEVTIPWLKALNKPVVYVLGNHEYYGRSITQAVADAKALAAGSGVHVLEREAVVIQGVRFLGATLWSSFGGWTADLIWEALRRAGDYRHILAGDWRDQPGNERWLKAHCSKARVPLPERDGETPAKFHPAMAYREHVRTLKWLERELSKASSDIPTVVVSHHAPTLESLRAAGVREHLLDPRNWSQHLRDEDLIFPALYATDLDSLLKQHQKKISLWAHGHLHHGLDLVVKGVRVVCNPRGRTIRPLTIASLSTYALMGIRMNEQDVARSQAVAAQNPFRGDAAEFEPDLVIDLEDGLCRPIILAVAPSLARMYTLRQSVENYLPYVFEGAKFQRQAIVRAISDDCRLFREELARIHEKISHHLDDFFSTPVIRRLPAPAAEPHEPWENPLNGPLTESDYRDVVALMDSWITWAQQLHLAPKEVMVQWAAQAYRLLRSLEKLGVPATIRRPGVNALRSVKSDIITALVEIDEEKCLDMESKFYEQANPRCRRRWCPSVYNPQAEGESEPAGLSLKDLAPWNLGLPLFTYP